MRTRKKKKFACVLTLAMLSSALMVGGPPAFALSEGVVVYDQQGAQASGSEGAPTSQSNEGVFIYYYVLPYIYY